MNIFVEALKEFGMGLGFIIAIFGGFGLAIYSASYVLNRVFDNVLKGRKFRAALWGSTYLIFAYLCLVISIFVRKL